MKYYKVDHNINKDSEIIRSKGTRIIVNPNSVLKKTFDTKKEKAYIA